MITLSTKISLIIGITIFIVLGVLGFFIYKQIEMSHQLNDMQKSLIETKQLADNISRAQTQYASKEDIESFAKQQNINLDVIKKDLGALNAQIQGINGVSIISTPQNNTNVPSTYITPNPEPSNTPNTSDPYGYLRNTAHLAINESFGDTSVPFGEVAFSAWKEKPWDITISKRKYSFTSVLGMDQNGRHYTYNKFAVIVNGKNYDLKIDENKFLEEYPKNTFSWFNPRLFMFANGGIGISQVPIKGEFTPGVAVGIMSYGQTKQNPTLSILQAGVGYGVANKTLEISVSPIQYNIGKNIPLMNNTYVGPVIQANTKGNIIVGAGLSVGF